MASSLVNGTRRATATATLVTGCDPAKTLVVEPGEELEQAANDSAIAMHADMTKIRLLRLITFTLCEDVLNAQQLPLSSKAFQVPGSPLAFNIVNTVIAVRQKR